MSKIDDAEWLEKQAEKFSPEEKARALRIAKGWRAEHEKDQAARTPRSNPWPTEKEAEREQGVRYRSGEAACDELDKMAGIGRYSEAAMNKVHQTATETIFGGPAPR